VADNVDPFHDPVLKRRNIAEHPEHPLYRFVDVDILQTSKSGTAFNWTRCSPAPSTSSFIRPRVPVC